ncbi:hypothetical protein [Acinetobacter sp. MD2]|uniref:hypothetical protein n=1 Tax=Acinetobacter sp. MD2 TaxID=2600066 RepID=UPI002D1E58C8|nr:hypothetical protein [Acinetobacter sp. MD2]MEB3766405.1 hypothetical protein [Acinetobacter sp. MD2]
MIEHRQQLLTSMGVGLWAPRQLVARSISVNSIWRDQNEDLPALKIEFQLEQPLTEIQSKSFPIIEKTQTSIDDTFIEVASSSITHAVTESVPLQITEFRIYALINTHFVVLVEQQQLPPECQNLWKNIQTNLNLVEADLQWPFPLFDLQDGNSAQDYIHGFFDVIATDKPLFCLGNFPIRIMRPIEILPSLTEMLQQPIRKQVLWKTIAALIE